MYSMTFFAPREHRHRFVLIEEIVPAWHEAIERVFTITVLAWYTSRMGMPTIGDDGTVFAAGLTTSFAPSTIRTRGVSQHE